MRIYVLRRLFAWALIFIGAMFVVFVVVGLVPRLYSTFMIPHDAAPEAIHEWRYMHAPNPPILAEFARYMANAFKGDFGITYRGMTYLRPVPVVDEVMSRFYYTFWLSMFVLPASFALAVPIGALAVVKKGTWIDKSVRIITLLGRSVPVFGLGLFVVLAWVLATNWLPSSGPRTLMQVIGLPAITLGIVTFAAMAEAIRVSLLESRNQRYLQTEYSSDILKGKATYKHILKNARMPALSALRIYLGTFFSGIIITESVFAVPGIGRLLLQGVVALDYYLMLGCIFMFILSYVVLNFLIDIAQAAINPRVREHGKC